LFGADDGKGGQAAGVLVRERQSQRQESAASAEPSAGCSGPSSGSVTREMKYKVGRRVEQIATGPGGIERVSVAVVARSATVIDESRVRSLAGHAVGLNVERGDSLAVVFLSMAGGRRDNPRAAPHQPEEPTPAEIELITQRVREWLDERPNHAPG